MVTIPALRAELTTDPQSLGYAALIAAGADAALADALNLVRAGIRVFRNDILAWEILAATVKADWDALAAGDKQLYLAMVSAGRLDATSASLRQMLGALFPAASPTRANLAAVGQRQGSRAEQLFGAAVSVAQVATALRG